MPSQRPGPAESSVVQQARLLQQADILLSNHLLLAVFRDQEAAGDTFGATILNQPHVVLANNLVGELALVSNAVNLLHPEGLIRPWLTWNRLDRADLERGRD